MAKYRNPRLDAELESENQNEKVEEVLKEEPKTVEDEVWKVRYGDLRRHSQEQEQRLKEKVDQLERQMQGISTGQIKPPKSEAEVNQWIKEYPDFAGILEVIIDKKVKDKTKDLKVQSEEIKKEKAVVELTRRHPDCKELFASPDFHEWLKKQSQRHQDSIYKSLNVDDADFVLEKYKTLTKKSSKSSGDDERSSTRDAASPVRTRSNTTVTDEFGGKYEFSESQIERESKKNSKWWDANEDKIKQAQRNNRILMDITGGAR